MENSPGMLCNLWMIRPHWHKEPCLAARRMLPLNKLMPLRHIEGHERKQRKQQVWAYFSSKTQETQGDMESAADLDPAISTTDASFSYASSFCPCERISHHKAGKPECRCHHIAFCAW